jgi:hypothetical protein
MEHPFPHGPSNIEFAMARGEIDYRLRRITTDVAGTIRFHMDFLYGPLARYLESNAVLRLFAQAPHQSPACQQASQGSRGGGAGTVHTLRLLHDAGGHCRNPVNIFSCNDSTDHGI